MKIPMKPAVVIALLFAAASAARAQEVIRTGPDGAGAPPAAAPEPQPQPAGDPEQSPQAIGAWARGVLAGAPAQRIEADQRPSAKGCTPPADRKPHGEVWAGVGTRGYREIGGVVTQPIGDCGQVTVAIDRVEGDFGRRRH